MVIISTRNLSFEYTYITSVTLQASLTVRHEEQVKEPGIEHVALRQDDRIVATAGWDNRLILKSTNANFNWTFVTLVCCGNLGFEFLISRRRSPLLHSDTTLQG